MDRGTDTTLSAHEQETFRQHAKRIELKTGKILFQQEDSARFVYLIERGIVKIFRSSLLGGVVTVGVRQCGDVIGIAEVLSGVSRYSYAEALEDCMLWQLDGELFLNSLYTNPGLAVKVTTALGSRLREAETTILNLVTLEVDRRLAKILLDLARKHSQPADKSSDVVIHLTQQELAEMIGTSRQTVTTTLQKFKAEGLIHSGKKSIEIIDLAGLETFANS